MNAAQFNQNLSGLINTAMAGVASGQIDPSQIIGTLELHKADVMRFLQDRARQQQIVPARVVPANGK